MAPQRESCHHLMWQVGKQAQSEDMNSDSGTLSDLRVLSLKAPSRIALTSQTGSQKKQLKGPSWQEGPTHHGACGTWAGTQVPGATVPGGLAWMPSVPQYLGGGGERGGLSGALRGRFHGSPATHSPAHSPWWPFCCSQQWVSCKAKAALDRWCSPSRPRVSGGPPSSRASSGGHR